MSEANSAAELERVIERYNEAWNAHDLDAIVAIHAPGMVFENHTAGERAEGPTSGITSARSSPTGRTSRSATPGCTSETVELEGTDHFDVVDVGHAAWGAVTDRLPMLLPS